MKMALKKTNSYLLINNATFVKKPSSQTDLCYVESCSLLTENLLHTLKHFAPPGMYSITQYSLSCKQSAIIMTTSHTVPNSFIHSFISRYSQGFHETVAAHVNRKSKREYFLAIVTANDMQ
jgi:hypothetical protein